MNIDFKRPDGTGGTFELPSFYSSDKTRIRAFGKGIVVVHPDYPPVYCNANTGQISYSDVVCLSDVLTVPDNGFVQSGRPSKCH
jgi:hypothetical protein